MNDRESLNRLSAEALDLAWASRFGNFSNFSGISCCGRGRTKKRDTGSVRVSNTIVLITKKLPWFSNLVSLRHSRIIPTLIGQKVPSQLRRRRSLKTHTSWLLRVGLRWHRRARDISRRISMSKARPKLQQNTVQQWSFQHRLKVLVRGQKRKRTRL
jgi:hypothetical protein